MRAQLLTLSAALLAALFATPGPARAAEVFSIDQAHTYIGFSILRQGLSNVIGRFNAYEGEIVFDAQNLGNSKVSVKISTKSLDSGFARRDRDISGPNFFNVQEFPEMTFISTKIEKTGPKTGRITGDLTVLGVTKSVTFDATFNARNIHPRFNVPFIGFTADGTIKRSDFGMTFLLRGVADEVNLHFEVLARLKK